MITALTIYTIACVIFLAGYAIGVYGERHYGLRAAQTELDREMAAYHSNEGYVLYDPAVVEEALREIETKTAEYSKRNDGPLVPGLAKRGYLRRVK